MRFCIFVLLLSFNANGLTLPPPTCPQISEMSVKILQMLQKSSAFTPTLIRLGKYASVEAVLCTHFGQIKDDNYSWIFLLSNHKYMKTLKVDYNKQL